MAAPARHRQAARFALLVLLGAGLITFTSCGSPEVGSIKLPDSLKRSGKPRNGPPAVKDSPTRLAPGDFRAAPAPRRKQPRRPGGR
jgi:hypothetical protein